MLDGITVLSESIHQFTISDEVNIIFACVLIAIFMMAFSGSLINEYFGLVVGICMFIFTLILFNNLTNKSTYTIYKVTISDEINFVEFMNKYEVISQEGQIYEIREKETE